MKINIQSLVILTAAAIFLTACHSDGTKKSETYLPEVPADTAGGVCCIKIGEWELIAIQDAHFMMSEQLFPDANATALQKMQPNGKVDASCNVFLLKKDGKNILFDAGSGIGLASQLKKLNIAPESIDYVLLTHFHGDHIGGLFNNEKAFFPKAEIWVSEMEYNAWMNDPMLQSRNQQVQQMIAVYEGRFHCYEFGKTVVEEITALNASGHTPGHTVFEIGNLLIFGDILHAADIQIFNPFLCATYDMDKVQAINTRVMFYNYAAQNSKMVAGMHLPFPGIISDFSKVWE